MKYRIGVISGDGIGPEIVAEARKALDCIGETFGHDFTYEEILMGGCSIDAVLLGSTSSILMPQSGQA